MGIYTNLPEHITEVDIIVTGGGTAGCIVAARLAKADPDLSILVIEGGSGDRNDPTIENPLFCFVHMDPNSKTNIAYQGNPPVELDRKAHIVPSGGVLGGGSSINLMMYSRGQRSDYDAWGTPGWTAEELVPYFKKLETYHGPNPTGTHGTDGPIHISRGTFHASQSEDAFVTAAAQVGWPEIEDLQIFDDANNGIQRAMRFVSPDGKRQSTATQYLHPLLQDNNRPNLHVLTETQVVRVLITDGKATGVEYTPNPTFHPDTPNSTRTVTARRQVILSCGALGTPLVLERSGVGNPAILTRASVPITVPLPGVGNAYQDHNLLVYPYLSSLAPSETLDALAANRPGHTPGDLLATQSPLLGWNGQDITCKLRPSPSDLPSLSPALRASWDADFAPHRDRPLMLMSLVSAMGGDLSTLPASPPSQYFSISTFTAYPYSRGHIHIVASSPPDEGGVNSPIDFEPGFFTDERDVAMHVWSYKKQREIARRMECYRGEHAACHPPFAADSAAVCGPAEGPIPPDAEDIVYSDEDHRVLEAWLRSNVGTTWHSLGTCAMRSREEMGVVDGRLRVYGVEGLRVADLSIVPGNIAANTACTAMMIGEKAAVLVGEDLGIKVE